MVKAVAGLLTDQVAALVVVEVAVMAVFKPGVQERLEKVIMAVLGKQMSLVVLPVGVVVKVLLGRMPRMP